MSPIRILLDSRDFSSNQQPSRSQHLPNRRCLTHGRSSNNNNNSSSSSNSNSNHKVKFLHLRPRTLGKANRATRTRIRTRTTKPNSKTSRANSRCTSSRVPTHSTRTPQFCHCITSLSKHPSKPLCNKPNQQLCKLRRLLHRHLASRILLLVFPAHLRASHCQLLKHQG